mmetsp:Transcript_117294/g.365219  ORF Transcript_117294/g.365219 Transcript_117294/m.365219 type:complete len:323 (+) Transcript_117294:433-1401(+)
MAFWIWPLQGQGNKSRGICPARAKRSAADKRAVANLLRLPPGTGAAPRACSPDDRQAPSIEVLGAVAALVPRRGGLGRPRPVPGLAADARPAHAVRVGLRLRLRLGLLLVLLLVVVAAKDLHKLGRRELPRARAGEDWGDVVALGAPVRVRAPLSVGVALVVAPASGHPGVIELPDAEALEGEEALGCHVEDREADLVDLGVRDDRVPLPRHDPPEGEESHVTHTSETRKRYSCGKSSFLFPPRTVYIMTRYGRMMTQRMVIPVKAGKTVKNFAVGPRSSMLPEPTNVMTSPVHTGIQSKEATYPQVKVINVTEKAVNAARR